MSKPRLVAIIEGAQARIQQERDLADYWRNMTARLIATEPKPEPDWSPETTLAEARRILRRLPVDPLAQEHRDELRANISSGGQIRRPGPRCAKDDNLLNAAGMCPRCDWYRIRKATA